LNTVRYEFIDAVGKMDRLDAVVLRHIYQNNIAVVRRGQQSGANNTVGILNLSTSTNSREDGIEVSIRHLAALSFFDTLPNNPNDGWYVNAINREFMRACYPEVGG
jgi:hypothetical protein